VTINGSEPLVEAAGLHKRFRVGEVDVHVLRGIDLTIAPGERIAIMGRSGSGKSTLMSILGCLDRPTSGHYRFDGRDVADLDDDTLSRLRGRAIGFVFQSSHLMPGVSVERNVELPMEYQHVPAPERRSRARALLDRVGMAHRLQHHPNQLSGGERQRVAIARALVNRPSLLLADEPTGNLDSEAAASVLSLFEEIHREMGLTTVTVTHDAEIGQRAERLVRLDDGHVVEVNGKPR